MALEAAFTDLSAKLRCLREAIEELRMAAVEERPAHGDLVLVDLYGDAADDLLGSLEEAVESAEIGVRCVGAPVDLDRARSALKTTHDRYNRVSQRFAADLARYERVADLAGLGRRRGREWGLWALNVKSALDRCQQPLFAANDALFLCWQELAERAGGTSVSVQTTSIGQLSTPAPAEQVRVAS